MQSDNHEKTSEPKICEHCSQPLDDSLYYCPSCGCPNPYYQKGEYMKADNSVTMHQTPGFPLMVVLATPCLLFFPIAGIPLLLTGAILEFQKKNLDKRYRINTLLFSIIATIATLIVLIQTIILAMSQNIY